MTLIEFTPPKALARLRLKFRERGFDMCFVGGFVRDLLHGDEPKDIDLCTDAMPEEAMAIYKAHDYRFFETGLAHGTISVKIDEALYEITSLRTEDQHDGRHAVVSYTRDWDEDLSRRDLTINAMALTFEGKLIDKFGGAKDLANGIVRFVGHPTARMTEDHLRILRWLRFHGRYGKEHALDPKTVEAALGVSSGLHDISRERIWSELRKIVVGPQAPYLLDAIYGMGLAAKMSLPELYTSVEFTRLHRDGDVKDPVTMIASMLVVPDHMEAVIQGLKWSGAEGRKGRFLSNHQRRGFDPQWMVAHDQIDKDWVVDLLHLNGRQEAAFKMQLWDPPVFPLTGADLVEHGMTPGPAIGSAMRSARTLWAQSHYKIDKTTLLAKVA